RPSGQTIPEIASAKPASSARYGVPTRNVNVPCLAFDEAEYGPGPKSCGSAFEIFGTSISRLNEFSTAFGVIVVPSTHLASLRSLNVTDFGVCVQEVAR